jgi:hypothetical protein
VFSLILRGILIDFTRDFILLKWYLISYEAFHFFQRGILFVVLHFTWYFVSFHVVFYFILCGFILLCFMIHGILFI